MRELTPTLSTLGHVQIRRDQSSNDAIVATMPLARRADELGYCHYWNGERHNVVGLMTTNPSVSSARSLRRRNGSERDR
ncbi:hypothetical protein [Streptomyces mirabilis]|uniref:hypothetical protein n=1 Tax=Streptomyces mirabilis TaxID=68239 RepID=UPI00331CC841